jgi:hypothetical protein
MFEDSWIGCALEGEGGHKEKEKVVFSSRFHLLPFDDWQVVPVDSLVTR